MSSGSGFTGIKPGLHETVPPGAVSVTTVASSVLPNSVSLRWQGVVDDPNGSGMDLYSLQRGGVTVAGSSQPEMTDFSVQPGTTYTYQILANDYHGNTSFSARFQVTTPPAQAIDPRRVGVSSLGSHWGGGGEQIDTLSGNLNYSLPLVTAQGRTSWTVPVGLSYNSQNWRNDSASGVGTSNWQLGDDVGYGFGWKAQIGSITPYYVTWYTGADHYVYTDGSGAEYRLDQNNNGVWSSSQGIYVWFDANANVLHFKDGTFWTMGCTSGGTEADAGTLYPTVLEDPNGNQVIVAYLAGAGVAGTVNTSARISTIEDVRGKGSASYTFSWDSGSPTPHLTGITNALGTPETYTFSIVGNYALEPPFGSDPLWSGQTTAHLVSVSPATGPAYQFTYDTAGAAELQQVTVPSGGHLRWVYANGSYTSPTLTRLLREVSTRYVAADALGQNEWQPYTFSHNDSANPNPTVHANTTLVDASGVGAKTWSFYTPNNATYAWQVGLAYRYSQAASSGGTVLSSAAYTWVLDGANNPYVGTTATTLDPASANATTSTVQTLDSYGNVLTQQVYDYGNATTPIRSYTNTWLHASNSNYANAYIRNRLLTSTVTDNQNNTVTLVSNTYDTGSLAAVSPAPTEFDTTVGSASNTLRGNVTQTVSPGSTVNYAYNVTGQMVTGANAMSGTGASLTYSSATNFAAPDTAAPLAGAGDVQNSHTVTQASPSALQGSFSYNNALALVSSVMPNAATSSQTISPSTGLLTSSVSVYGATTNYSYAYSPTVITATTNSHWSKSYKDGFGRDLAVETGYGSTVVSHTDTKYAPCACSPLGKANYISLPYGISGGTITASDGTSNIGWNSYSYDGLGRTVTQTAADTSPTSYVYLGNTVKVTDPAGNWKRYTSDTLGNLVKVEEPNPAYGQADNTGTNFVTNYAYDVEGHLVSVSMPRPSGSGSYTQTRTFNYNLATNTLTSATNPENGTVSYTYYGDGLLKSKTDAKGQQAWYSYDGYGRLAYIDRFTNATTWDYCHSVALTYDTGSSGSTNVVGRISTALTGDVNACASTVTEGYSYTPGGLVTAKGYNINFPGYSSGNDFYLGYGYGPNATFSYDTEGHQTGYNSFVYTLDAMGRPTALTETGPGTVWVQNAAYGPSGEMQTMQYRSSSGSYFTENRTYNSRVQLIELASNLAGKPLTDLKYNYTAGVNNGQAGSMTDVLSKEQTVYSYDSLKRLIKGEASVSLWGQSFGYDGWGNLFSKMPTAGHTGTTMSLSVDQTTNRVMATGFAYDLNGNMTSIPGTPQNIALSYDVENRTGGTWYDQQNQPLDRTGVWNEYGLHGERLSTWTYSAGSLGDECQAEGIYLVCWPNFTATQVSRNIYFGGRLIQSNGTTVATDRLGSVRVDENGNKAEYYPYGETVSSSVTVPDLFGTYAREASGLDYANQRFYASSYGRFNSPDPFRASAGPKSPLSWNRYSYTRGDPVNRRDPNGTCDEDTDYSVNVCDTDDDAPISRATEGGGGGGDQGASGSAGGGSTFGTWAGTIYLANTGGPDQALTSALDLVKQRLNQDPQCQKFLGSGIGSPSSFIVDLFSANIGTATFQAGYSGTSVPGTAAITLQSANGSLDATSGYAVYVNTAGLFYGAGPLAGASFNFGSDTLLAGSTAAQMAILLHELGHFANLPGFQPDQNSSTIQTSENNSIVTNCGGIINP